MNKLSLAALFLVALALIACGPLANGADSNREPVTDYAGLLEALGTGGATVEPSGSVSQPFLSVEGQSLTLGGEQFQVFEYADESAAAADAQLVSPDGSSVGTTMITWVAPPHFYRSGRLIVLYLGNNADTLRLLESLLGPQFAGA